MRPTGIHYPLREKNRDSGPKVTVGLVPAFPVNKVQTPIRNPMVYGQYGCVHKPCPSLHRLGASTVLSSFPDYPQKYGSLFPDLSPFSGVLSRLASGPLFVRSLAMPAIQISTHTFDITG